MSKFACSRCGACCNETFYQSGDYLFGLYLEPSEVGAFPPEAVAPLFGRGMPIEITAYQLSVNRCPNFTNESGVGRCKIHADRPLTCRAFPVQSPFKVAQQCPVVRAAMDGIDPDSLRPELEAHHRKVELMIGRPENEWVWPLNKKAWISLEKTI